MTISNHEFEKIRKLNIDEHQTVCAFEYWESDFPQNSYLGQHVAVVKNAFASGITRSELVNFYRDTNISSVTKFIAAMVWGHEAAQGGRRDSRGPWKLSQMFSNPKDSEAAIKLVALNDNLSITKAYKLLNNTLTRCGPNFFTKHFYFLGKAQGLNPYPLIFDDRVANGLVKVAMNDSTNLSIVKVSAARNPDSYLQYLAYAKQEANRIGCELDQIEYYFFNL